VYNYFMNQPLLDTIDLEILMHKDAHFGGSYEVMIDYYKEDGLGVQEEFDIERIKELAAFDKEGYLSEEILPELAKNDVIFSKDLYKKLRDCYEQDEELLQKLSDLILTESYDPIEEIEALSNFHQRAVKPLLEIIIQDHFYNSLNPGYGKAPINAALTLKKIGDPKAIPYLFNALGKSFTVDEVLIDTLISFGPAGEEFLQNRLKGTPYTKDNYLAAMALSSFPIRDETAKLALSLLEEPSTFSKGSYSSYLICICEGLESEEDRMKFAHVANTSGLKKNLADEMKMILSFWKNNT